MGAATSGTKGAETADEAKAGEPVESSNLLPDADPEDALKPRFYDSLLKPADVKPGESLELPKEITALHLPRLLGAIHIILFHFGGCCLNYSGISSWGNSWIN